MDRRLLALAEYIFFALLFVIILLSPAPQATFTPALTPIPSPVMQGSDLTVALDAGHGGFDGGAVGLDTGVAEAGLNLTVAKLVQHGLEEKGIQVIMTRESEQALGENKDSDMAARKRIISAPEVDLIVSIHMNKFSDRSVKGPMAFYMEGSAQGQRFAEQVIVAVCESTDHPPRFANPGDYFMVRVGSAPSVIVECGFLSNSSEEALLQTAEYQKKLADGIVQGIMAYAAETMAASPPADTATP